MSITTETERARVLEVLEAHQPATCEQIREALGLPWAKRGTVRNRVYELVRERRVISDEGWPARYAINEDDTRPTLERCICGQHRDCPDGWHYGDDLPCSCTPDCALPA